MCDGLALSCRCLASHASKSLGLSQFFGLASACPDYFSLPKETEGRMSHLVDQTVVLLCSEQ